MAKVTKSLIEPKGLKPEDTYVYDFGSPDYLDGAVMQYAVREVCWHEGVRRSAAIAYFGKLEDAQLFADTRNAAMQRARNKENDT